MKPNPFYLIIVALLFCCGTVKGQEAPVMVVEKEGESYFLTLEVSDILFSKIIRHCQKETKINIILDPTIKVPLTISFEKIPFFEAIKILTKKAKCRLVQFSKNIWWISQPTLITMNFVTSDVKDALTKISTIADINLIYPEDFKGSFSINFIETPFDQAIKDIILAISDNFELLHKGNIYWISSKSKPLVKLPQKIGIWKDCQRKISLVMEGSQIFNVLDALQAQTGIVIRGQKTLAFDPKFIINLYNVPLQEALEFIAAKMGYGITKIDKNTFQFTRKNELSIEFEDAMIDKVIRTISIVTRKKITHPNNFHKKINIRLKSVSWDEALEAIVKVADPNYEIITDSDDIIHIETNN